MSRLDSRSKFPEEMENYLEFNGWHFNKKMCHWASSKMYKKSSDNKKQYIQPYTMEQIQNFQTQYDIKFDLTYDAVYIANMCKADFLGSSVIDEKHLIMYVKDVVEDQDAYEGLPFTRFYADCIGSGISIPWEDMI